MFAVMVRVSSRRGRGREKLGGFLALSVVATGALGACSVYAPALLGRADDAMEGELPGRGGTPGREPDPATAAADGAVDVNAGAANEGPFASGGSTGAGTGGATSAGSGGGGGGSDAGAAAGSDGGGGVGASSGAGGNGGGAAMVPSLLDNFEDGDLYLAPVSQRTGIWFRYDDGTPGMLGPDPLVCSPLVGAPAAVGKYAMHVTASGFSGWGSGLGADFIIGRKVYDISGYSGIRFWARGATGKNRDYRIQISDTTTDARGGKCNPASDAPNTEMCGNHFGKFVTVTTRWATYEVRFDAMTQLAGWGLREAALDTAHSYGIQITTLANTDDDLWLDQLEFF